MPLTLAEFTADLFAPYLGQIFFFGAVTAQDFEITAPETTRMKLVQVHRHRCGAEEEQAGRGRQPFSLWFEHLSGSPPRGVCRLIQRDFGACELFLSRISIPGRNPDVAVYEAVFN
jgi:hypothetical protein